uniref:Damage-control phosphatase ARMT1-like metal-binding domain-containing protein n=1 Tax=Candidatus Kentrum sp. FW TaxID=2126338 RepID=A0A450SWT7_9GAMM|nr:MAG: hypothetical protein BECKFW1821A_GA0114235_10443 [Candidatus Kentron sp. FW]VFJ58500.1 MAG: hypothetical protein BECKFW1821B_GA0114236_10423 [Candidatus Kentron sp. FW]
MKNSLECYPCLLKMVVDIGKIATDDEEKRWEILQEGLEKIGAARKWVPITMGKEMQAIVSRLTNNSDPYKEIKKEYNRKAKTLISLLETEIARSDHELLTAIKLITTANIIDFMTLDPDQLDLSEFLRAKSSSDFKGTMDPASFIDALGKANSILYVADNCGEIIFDCHFINHFLADKTVYLSVRGGPALNDATKEDLDGISFHGHVKIMDTGDNSPGVVPETSSDGFRKIYRAVDLVILKGQGNFEGIGPPGRENVYSLFIAKCPVVARHAGCEVGDLVLTVPG